jgi:tetratricopeptide (TPR) repeat protein
MTPEQAFKDAERLLRSGDHAAAERTLAAAWPDMARAPAPVAHLMGLVRRAQQRPRDAEMLFRSAIAAAPGDPRHHFALAELLSGLGAHAPAADSYAAAMALDPRFPGVLRGFARAALSAGRAAEAEAVARRLVAEQPSAEVWDVLSTVLRAQDKLEEAVAAAEEAVKLDPASAPARHSRAVAMTRLGRNEEALAELNSLAARGVSSPALWLNRGIALLNLTRDAEAESMFADGVRRWPFDHHLQNALANTRWMRGAGPTFTRDYEAVVAQRPDALRLRLACADLLRRADFRDRSEELLREGLARAPEDPALLASLGVLLDEMDRTAEGLPFIQRAVARAPRLSANRANLACALLRLGRGEEALKEIEPARVAEPLNQEWICYETMALRQMGRPRYHELCDYELMVRPFELPVPPGYASIDEFNAALRESLMRLHVLETHPLDQSLRHGSQTTRSLLCVDDPVVRAYLAALDEPIRAYMDLMGVPDPSHPWSGRKTDNYRLAGCWSVRLKANGYHINHLHPAGWISSAYYVYVPPAVATGEGQQGWIKFGEPRWPTPGCTVEKVVQPQAGRLVLFPSYMWHGTIPFAEGERMTAPFDAVPV